jgi:hypothetical protein
VSSLFDAPVQLILLLAAVVAGHAPAAAPPVEPASIVHAARGPFAFSETIWLTALHDGRGGDASAVYRGRIFKTSGGRIYVPVLAEQRAILAARRSAAMARAVANDLALANKASLQTRLGRAASVRDLYAAHVFGLDLAAKLAVLQAAEPEARIALVLPELGAAFPEAANLLSGAQTVAGFYQRLPDGAEALAQINLALPSAADAPLQTAPHMVSALQNSIASRRAPLRGIIKDAPPHATEDASRADERVAELTWTTEVHRTP